MQRAPELEEVGSHTRIFTKEGLGTFKLDRGGSVRLRLFFTSCQVEKARVLHLKRGGQVCRWRVKGISTIGPGGRGLSFHSGLTQGATKDCILG